jgi:hypothetical protein
MNEALEMMWGFLIVVALGVLLLDWWSRRHDRHSKDRAA